MERFCDVGIDVKFLTVRLLEYAEGAMADVENPRPPFPPFTRESALAKVKAAENAWNSRNPEVVALAYTKDSEWRNRTEFFKGREAIKEFLTRKWAQELDYRLMKELWAFTDNHIAVRFEYEWHNEAGQWYITLNPKS